MADLTIMGSDVQVGVLIKYDETQTHFSLRSKGRVDVGRIAQSIQGGGGHSSAAGCTMPMPCAQAKPLMLDIIKRSSRKPLDGFLCVDNLRTVVVAVSRATRAPFLLCQASAALPARRASAWCIRRRWSARRRPGCSGRFFPHRHGPLIAVRNAFAFRRT